MRFTSYIRSNKEIYKNIWIVAFPIILQNVIDAAVNSVDVLMLNSVGQSAISAASLANSMVSIFFMFLYGIGTGIAMLAAQYYGKGDFKTIEIVEGIGLKFAVIVAVIGMVLCLTIPGVLMNIYTSDKELIALGERYLMFISPGLLFWAISAVYTSILRCIGKVSTSTVLEAVALISNVILNAIFIFGLFGVPRLGVVGVAIATSLSRLIQLIGCIIVSMNHPGVSLTFRTMFEKHRLLEKDFFSMALPAIGNDMVWGLAFFLVVAGKEQALLPPAPGAVFLAVRVRPAAYADPQPVLLARKAHRRFARDELQVRQRLADGQGVAGVLDGGAVLPPPDRVVVEPYLVDRHIRAPRAVHRGAGDVHLEGAVGPAVQRARPVDDAVFLRAAAAFQLQRHLHADDDPVAQVIQRKARGGNLLRGQSC